MRARHVFKYACTQILEYLRKRIYCIFFQQEFFKSFCFYVFRDAMGLYYHVCIIWSHLLLPFTRHLGGLSVFMLLCNICFNGTQCKQLLIIRYILVRLLHISSLFYSCLFFIVCNFSKNHGTKNGSRRIN
jgi:hypothetical protein